MAFKFKLPHLKTRREKERLAQQDQRKVFEDALTPYVKHEDVEKILRKIERDNVTRDKWNSLSKRKQIQVLRYIASKREGKK